jgi:hypothetical protein
MNEEAIESTWRATPLGQEGGQVELFCGKAAFARIRDLVLADAQIKDIETTNVRCLYIYECPRPEKDPRKALRRDRIALFGCAFVILTIGFVFFTGLQAIWVMITR